MVDGSIFLLHAPFPNLIATSPYNQWLFPYLPAMFSLVRFISRVTAHGNFNLSKAAYDPDSNTKGTQSK
jgi:hypothetical protein